MKPPAQYHRLEVPPKLAKLLASSKKYLCAYGGRGGGRSWAFALYCLTAGTRETHKILCAREVQKNIRDSSHALLKQWIQKVPYFQSFYTVERDRIYGRNGTEFLFTGLQEAGSHNLKSMEGVTIVWIDEAATVSHRSWEFLIPTIREEGSRWLIGWNPQTEDDPVWKQIVEDRAELAEVVQVSYQDNPFCPAILIEEAELMLKNNPDEYEHVWLGKPRGTSSNQVIGRDLVSKALGCTPDATDELAVLAIDPARYGDDPTAFLVRKGNDLLHVEEKLHLEHDQIAAHALDLMTRYSCHVAIIDAGGGYGGGAKREMQKAGANIQGFQGSWPCPKHPEFANMRAKSWFATKEWLKKARIPRNKELQEQLTCQTYKYDDKGRKILTSKEEMRRDGIASPNLGDALAMSLSIQAIDRDKPKEKRPRKEATGPYGWN